MNIRTKVRVGTRASPLALIQTEEIISLLRVEFPDSTFGVVRVSTQGDRQKDAPLATLERGTFVKDIERALLRDEIDLAVHSAKDLAPAVPEGLTILAVGHRQDARDVLISKSDRSIFELPSGARLGTSSPRREAQIKVIRPDVKMVPIRGNVDTRLRKAKSTDFDGVVLAAAGLARLDRLSEVTEYLNPREVTPDVGQGTLVAEVRDEDRAVQEMLSTIISPPTDRAFRAERAFLKTLGGGCTSPVAAYATVRNDRLTIMAMAATPDGSKIVRSKLEWDAEASDEAGETVASMLLESGASDIVG